MHLNLFQIKNILYRLGILRFTLGLFFLGQADILFRQGKTYAAIRKLSWIMRLSQSSFLKQKAQKRIQIFVDQIKVSGTNPLLEEFLASDEAKRLRDHYNKSTQGDRDSLSGKLLVLKEYNKATQEPGVICLKYTSSFKEIFLYHEAKELFQNYYIILEPSWYCVCDPDILMFVNTTREVFVQSVEKEDEQFLKALQSNLMHVPLTSNSWTDLSLFYPDKAIEKEYDLVYIANWALYKRHDRLFKALRQIKQKDITLNVLLIGFSWSVEPRKRLDIEDDIRASGIEDMVTILESVPAEKVNYYLNQSRFSILLSKLEGACKAVAEAMAAGLPVLVDEDFKGGAQTLINSQTGIFFDDSNLADQILWIKDHCQEFESRKWIQEHHNAKRSTLILNDALKELALHKREIWTEDIKQKANIRGFATIKTGAKNEG